SSHHSPANAARRPGRRSSKLASAPEFTSTTYTAPPPSACDASNAAQTRGTRPSSPPGPPTWPRATRIHRPSSTSSSRPKETCSGEQQWWRARCVASFATFVLVGSTPEDPLQVPQNFDVRDADLETLLHRLSR